MNIILRKKIIVLISLVSIFLASFIVFSAIKIYANSSDDEILSEYELNSTISIPDYTLNKYNVFATGYSLIYPNGVEYAGRNHTLNMSGKYTVVYSAKVNNKTVIEEKEFLVRNKLYSYKSDNSSAFFGVNEKYADGQEGLVFSIANKDKISFNKIIDLSDNTNKNKLLSFYVTPSEKGNFDAANLIFRFTDAYDSENYMDITFRCIYGVRTFGNEITYIVGQTPGNPTIGGTGSVAKIGHSLFGYPVYVNFCDNEKFGKTIDRPFNIFYDNNNKTILTDNATASSVPAELRNIIADLDDPLVLTNPWKGFTTGEVYLSVFATSYRSPTFNFVLTELDGLDLTKKEFIDEKSPEITIDLDNDTPNGLLNKKYKIFNAYAKDNYDGSVKVDANVYLKYGTNAQVDVRIEDGYFIPDKIGKYTVVYKSKDSFGNTAQKLVEVDILDDISLDFDIIGKQSEVYSGEDIKAFENISISNAKGKTNIVATAILDSEMLTLDSDYCFSPLKSGTYKIKVIVSDYVETKEHTFYLTVKPNPTPVFFGETVLPLYFIKGQTYTIPNFNGYDLSSGTPKEINSTIYAKQDKDSEKQITDNNLVVNAEEKVEIKYTISTNSGVANKIYTIDVVSPIDIVTGNYDVSKFFVLNSGSGKIYTDSDYLHFNTSENMSSVIFANAVQVENFETVFRYEENKTAFDGINIYLTDKNDKNIRIKITYKWKDLLGYIAINDGDLIQVPIDDSTSDRSKLFIGYINNNKQVYGHNSLMMNVDKTVFGEEFNGFPSNMAYIEYEFIDVKGDAGICINRINNQVMYAFDGEESYKPEIFVDKANGDVELNSIVKIYGANAYDVLSNNVNLTLNVYAPDGTTLTSTDGVKLDSTCDPSRDYFIKANQYGIYNITFIALDFLGNRTVFSYGFAVVDTTAPTININTNEQTVKVGKTVKVNSYTVSDDIDNKEDIKVSIYVLTPGEVFEVIKDGEFTIVQKGIYYVYYYCYDSSNNISIVNYRISAY